MSSLESLDSDRRSLVRDLVEALKDVPGLEGIVLGGSYARGMARADSDIDLGLFHAEASPLDVAKIRDVATGFPGSRDPLRRQPLGNCRRANCSASPAPLASALHAI